MVHLWIGHCHLSTAFWNINHYVHFLWLHDSWEILRNWSPIPEIFKGSEFWEFFPRNFSWRNYWELLQNISPKIPEKCSGLGHQFYGFFRKLNKIPSLKKFLRVSQEFFLEKFLIISLEYFSGNSREILRAWLTILRFFGEQNKRLSFEKFLRISLEFFSRNSQQFIKNFQVLFISSRCLWGSLLFCTKSFLSLHPYW